MAENGYPLENAIVERVNGIKEEYLNDYKVDNLVQRAKNLVFIFIHWFL